MKILALEVDVPEGSPEAFTDELLREEAAHVWRLHKAGIIRELYFRMDRDGAVLVLEAFDEREARSYLATLPLVAQGLITFELIPLKAYPGFERLFG